MTTRAPGAKIGKDMYQQSLFSDQMARTCDIPKMFSPFIMAIVGHIKNVQHLEFPSLYVVNPSLVSIA